MLLLKKVEPKDGRDSLDVGRSKVEQLMHVLFLVENVIICISM